MDSEFKCFVVLAIAFFGGAFGIIFASQYMAHQRDLACIQQGGTPANKTCLRGVAHE